MNELLFGISFIVLVILLLQREKIVNFLSYNLNIKIKSNIFLFILSFLFILLIIAGVLLSNTKEKFSKISNNYDNMRGTNEGKRPHRYFDINTYD